MTNDANYLYKEPCTACGSSDANAVYDDGHKYCFACEHYTPSEGEAATPQRPRRRVSGLIMDGESRPLGKRHISQETCEKFGYTLARYHGSKVHVAPYYDADGNLVAQHLRTVTKDFPWLGDPSDALPFGSNVWPKSGKMLVLTEGEIDAMSMSQVQGNRWPVWSIGCGAGQGEANKVKKYIGKHLDLFKGFEKVVVMFDMDEPGRDSAKAVAAVLGPKAHIAELPMKDANDMLVAGRVEELLNAMWRAQSWKPDGIVSVEDIKEQVLTLRERGKDFFLPSFTELTFGRRYGEVWVLGAGTGTGKTDFLMQENAHAILTHKEPVGLFFLETPPPEVVIRLAGKIASKPYHVPDGSWTEEELKESVEALAQANLVHLYDSFGMTEWDRVKERIRYLNHAHGVRYFTVDNLTAFAAAASDERRELERVMAEAAGLAQELKSFIWIVSHLATPDGTPHENGGQIQLRHLKGSRAIAAWAHGVIGLERDQQAEDPEARRTTTLRILKDRFSGRATGATLDIQYDFATGRLVEAPEAHLRNALTEDGEQTEGDF